MPPHEIVHQMSQPPWMNLERKRRKKPLEDAQRIGDRVPPPQPVTIVHGSYPNLLNWTGESYVVGVS